MSRNVKGTLPVNYRHLLPRVIPWKVVKKYNDRNIDRGRNNYNPKVNIENTYNEGDKVWIKNFKDNTWDEGVVVSKHTSPRSYVVKTIANNRLLRRNIIHLKKYFVRNSRVNFNMPLDLDMDKEPNENIPVGDNQQEEIKTRYGRVIHKPDRWGYEKM
jgi:hypothetical protein